MQRINSVTVSQCLYYQIKKPFKSGKIDTNADWGGDKSCAVNTTAYKKPCLRASLFYDDLACKKFTKCSVRKIKPGNYPSPVINTNFIKKSNEKLVRAEILFTQLLAGRPEQSFPKIC